jgi:hypothetical protein
VTAATFAGTGIWRAVMAAAGGRCECTGGCGRSHTRDGARCPQESLPGRPLRAVPRTPVPNVAAAYLPAASLTALCSPCADDIARREDPAATARAIPFRIPGGAPMKRPETPDPVIVLVIDEIGALEEADVPTGLRAHLEQVLIAGRQAGATFLPGGIARPAPTWLDAGDLAALTSALVAAQVRRAA